MIRPDRGLSPEGEEEVSTPHVETEKEQPDIAMEKTDPDGEPESTPVRCPMLKQPSFGEFKCYGATDNGSSFEAEDLPMTPVLQIRRSTEEVDEERFWEQEPLIKPPDSLGVTKSMSAPSLTSCTPTSQSPTSLATTDPSEPTSAAKDEGEAQLESEQTAASSPAPISLPPPQEFGRGNPFMLFLCLSILLEHREQIMKQNMGYDELAMHFNRLVRRHNLNRVLHRAKALFADYLQSKVWDSEEGDEAAAESPSTS